MEIRPYYLNIGENSEIKKMIFFIVKSLNFYY